ncbi:MAG: alginate lyase family protein, partial [Candidatus Hydrogenedentota bacterium]
MRNALMIAFVGCMGFACSAQPPQTGTPRVFLTDASKLIEVRARVAAGDPALKPAMDKLLAEAEAALNKGPFSVTDKPMTPPSGDKHDYMSVGPYWWPNPDTDDGLPYVRRDGEVNPERNEYDNVGQSAMARAVRTLALAYFLTGKELYAEHAATLLRVWYLNENTRMNPNLKYGQAIPGRVDGRGIGIIDTAHLARLLDAVGMLQGSEAWTEQDQQGLQQWFSEYLDWILTHPYGKNERNTRNNHGTWYDVQAATYALFTNRRDIAREVLESVPENRIAKHFQPDGRQPHELARTKSYGYSAMNLAGFFDLATLGEHFDMNLWNWESEDGRG